ncbi:MULTISPECIES: hypothetical protein [Aliarcobacter]|uniref:Membrane protein n=2 Tax=Aliarcobacter skirrowii TaxID=28200 RepID=A0AAD0WND0_9BACT|nr:MULTISPECIES: hypothetical protein [Aliarcobacter]AXX84656.1 putative membrane protein [Aliarcobacter skirrowii CCUG 10374]KAB0620201.1 hypothetical protein F7P70_08095 [Aliarcobacter skirrowii CCUG 10374]MDX4069826.1 hypothetical protein [Aliarcobacter skirrowii]OCL85520.1 hypothetical protein AAX26_01948 [Aliarcobacter thereius]RXI25384.1 hypothetical protein CP959_08125 [Aliarcobacter skirrowii CCUG 10374]
MKKEFTQKVVYILTESFLPVIFWFGLFGIFIISIDESTMNGIRDFQIPKYIDTLLKNNILEFVAVIYILYVVKDFKDSKNNV